MANTDARVNRLYAVHGPVGVAEVEVNFTSERVYPNQGAEPMIYAKVYEIRGSTTRITTPVSNFLDIVIQADGNLSEVRMFGDSGTGTTTFNVRLNGVALFSGGSRPALITGEASIITDELTHPVEIGDTVRLDIEAITGSGLFPDLTFAIVVDA